MGKSEISTPGELEGIYREYRFLFEICQHPNIAKCRSMLNSQTRVYVVFDFAGPRNLAQVCAARSPKHLSTDEAIDVFEQLVAAVLHCHSKDIVHRCICLEHVT